MTPTQMDPFHSLDTIVSVLVIWKAYRTPTDQTKSNMYGRLKVAGRLQRLYSLL